MYRKVFEYDNVLLDKTITHVSEWRTIKYTPPRGCTPQVMEYGSRCISPRTAAFRCVIFSCTKESRLVVYRSENVSNGI